MCDKLQVAIVNPSTVNPLTLELTDFGVNPSLSSDDTLTAEGAALILGENEEDPVLRSQPKKGEDVTSSLLANYDSTDECESEDGMGASSEQ